MRPGRYCRVLEDLTAQSKSLALRTILTKRIIEMADQGLMDVTDLHDDALAFVQHNPPPADRKGSHVAATRAYQRVSRAIKNSETQRHRANSLWLWTRRP